MTFSECFSKVRVAIHLETLLAEMFLAGHNREDMLAKEERWMI
jgi:hypothetical protein